MTMTRLGLLLLVLNVLVVVGGTAVNYMLLRPALFGQGAAVSGEQSDEPVEYEFYPVEKIIVSVRGDGREHYFVLDLVLQAEAADKPRDFAPVEPLVRNSVVAYLSAFKFDELRSLPITELQARLEAAISADFARKRVAAPFSQVLVSKFLVQ